MPVLPVQLDVNIGLVSFEAPTVESVKATTEGVFITFSKYMSEAELSASNIGLYLNDELVPLSGKIVLLDSEKVNEGSSVSYTKTVMLTNLELSVSDNVQVVISNEVKSYAGVRMAERYDSGSIDVTEPVKLAAPVASVSSGEVEKNTVVTLSAEDGAVIYYTTDGTTPSKTSKIYKTGLFISENITIKAIAVKAGMKDSDVLSVSYTIKDEDPDEDPRPAKVT
ncbi:MAG: chitobiase/beta-hexosaminidase C-terminal domain-containing protein, partial [Oscillospiraceae bacterium]|nr:chitobiase/beta-hexosaminidase C-terminal domain-containing protein [Oscillospiraceae bacterium]